MKAITYRLLISSVIVVAVNSQAAVYEEVEPNNPPSFIETAFNIDPHFSTEFNADIGDASGANISQTSRHVTINGSGDGSFDYFSFTAAAGETGVFDIDYGAEGVGKVDTQLALWNDKGVILSVNDDYSEVAGSGGSASTLDSFIEYVFAEAGTYIIGVAEYNSSAFETGWAGDVLDEGDTYTLQVALSAEPNHVPVPGAAYLFLSGITALGFVGRNRATK